MSWKNKIIMKSNDYKNRKGIENKFIIVIAGPIGVGKTTLSKLLSKHYDCLHISEDKIAKQIFPHVYKDVEDDPK